MRVWLSQCLCPKRHAILAASAATDDPEGLLETLQAAVVSMVAHGSINPWCALCGATSETWRYEVGRTRFATMAEAEPFLRQCEAAQEQSANLLKALGLAVDPAPGAQN